MDSSALFYYQDSDGNPVPIYATISSTHQAKISGSLKSRHVEKRDAYHEKYRNKNKKRADYANCVASQEDTILPASYQASLYVADAEKYLTLMSSSSERYTTWFGEYDSKRKDTVLSHYANIRSTNVKSYTFDCGCVDDVYGKILVPK